MALIKTIRGKEPSFGERCYLADNATVIGDVIMGDDCSVWFNTVIRGDVHYIRIGDRVNIQDNAVVHCTFQKASVTIGNDVSIAHGAIIHGCTLKDNILVGMGAIIMDHAVIGANSIIAAGSLILENTIVEENSIYAGSPAKKIKSTNSDITNGTIKRIAKDYLKYSSWYRDNEK